MHQPCVSTIFWCIAVKDHLVRSRGSFKTIIGKGMIRMKIEGKDQISSCKDEDFVFGMFVQEA